VSKPFTLQNLRAIAALDELDRAYDALGVGLALEFVVGEDVLEVSDVSSSAFGRDDGVGEEGDVGHAEIEALPCHWMDSVGGVAD